MYMGQFSDLGTTFYALEMDGRYSEANPLADDCEDVAELKVALLGLSELLARRYPAHADSIHWITAIAGYLAGGINLYTLSQH